MLRSDRSVFFWGCPIETVQSYVCCVEFPRSHVKSSKKEYIQLINFNMLTQIPQILSFQQVTY